MNTHSDIFVRFIGETETWVCFGFCVCLSMPAKREFIDMLNISFTVDGGFEARRSGKVSPPIREEELPHTR